MKRREKETKRKTESAGLLICGFVDGSGYDFATFLLYCMRHVQSRRVDASFACHLRINIFNDDD